MGVYNFKRPAVKLLCCNTRHNNIRQEGICDACGGELVLRDDDKPETVAKRLDVYHTQTQPLIDFYAGEKILKEVDGTKDVAEVFDAITAILAGSVDA